MSRLIRAAGVGGELALAFDDGTECYLPLEMLRRACPCAICQGEPDALGRTAERSPAEVGRDGWELRKMEPVGAYGLQLYWGDGHSTGIYGFDYLRKLAAS